MITQQGVKCNACGDRIFSNSRHDFVRCKCDHTFIDGGFDYVRVGFKEEDGPPEQITRELSAPPPFHFRGRARRKRTQETG